MKKKHMIIVAVVILLIALSGLTAWLLIRQHNAKFVKIDEQMIPRDQTSLDYSGQVIPDTQLLQQFTNLQELNVTNTGLTVEGYEALKAALPGCKICWSVPFQGKFYPEETIELTVSSISQADVDMLKYYPDLQTVDALACRDFDMLDSLMATYPDLQVLWQLDVGSQQLTEGAETLVLGDGTAEELAFALQRIPTLRNVDASGCYDYAALEALKEQYPDCVIYYQISFADTLLEQTVETLQITCDQIPELEAVLPYLPALKEVHFEEEALDLDAAYSFRMAHPELNVHYAFTLCGVSVTSDDTVVDLSGIPMEDAQAVEDSLKYFKQLQKVVMVDCGLDNDVMCPLSDRNSAVHFVWNMRINYYITVRTDITYFMPYQFGSQITDQELQLLKYCRELICIDLGHIKISDVSFLAYTPHMKYLLLCDTNVSDISACAGLQELVFCELFMTKVSDYSPLLSCPNLRDLNICYAPPKSPDDLKQMTWLDNLWIKGYWDEEGIELLRQSLPNTRIVISNRDYAGSTEEGWRLLQNYFDMRDFLGMPYMQG